MKPQYFPKQLPANIDEVIDGLIVDHHKPPAPMVPAGAKIACIGSCFAQEIADSLARRGKAAIPFSISERLNTTFALKHTLRNAFENTPFPEGYLPTHMTPARPLARSPCAKRTHTSSR